VKNFDERCLKHLEIQKKNLRSRCRIISAEPEPEPESHREAAQAPIPILMFSYIDLKNKMIHILKDFSYEKLVQNAPSSGTKNKKWFEFFILSKFYFSMPELEPRPPVMEQPQFFHLQPGTEPLKIDAPLQLQYVNMYPEEPKKPIDLISSKFDLHE
jgi:hypothetical protein